MRLANSVLLLMALSVAASAGTAFEWKDVGDGRIELRENGKPALVYNYGPQLKPGAPEDRRRCCYVFPLYTPDGVSMLDDFPRDHYHHRGIFWAWPRVEIAGKTYDLWMKMDIKDRTVKTATSAKGGKAVLVADNVWQVDGKDVVREHVVLTVLPAAGPTRPLLLDITLQAIDAQVILRGSPDKSKSYGGLCVRFAKRDGTVIRANGNAISKDEDLNPHAFAELEGVYGGKRATLRVIPDSSNPGGPSQWCLRNYGFVGSSFPGRNQQDAGYTLKPGKPVTLKYRVLATDVR